MKAVWVISVVIVVFSIAGESDYNEAIAESKRYCEMVQQGAWPDYNKDMECSKWIEINSESKSNERLLSF